MNWLITATPPTPNGSIHLGHISGPYLSADIFKRASALLGSSSSYICYGDDNQSYVVTSAKKLNTSVPELLEKNNELIKKAFNSYHIDMDLYSRPNEEYSKFISKTFQELFFSGELIEKEISIFYDPQGEQYLFESFIQGKCKICLAQTRGGICESCGHPNNGVELIQPSAVLTNNSELEIRKIRSIVLPIEKYRKPLENFYNDKKGKWRPHILHFVNELLSKKMDEYPLSYPQKFGIPVGIDGWEEYSWNVWAEMGIGLLFFLQSINHKTFDSGNLIQFLGFDNSYFFSIVHVTLQFALQNITDIPIKLPEYIITNEFLNLEDMKFSTSNGHAIWAEDLLQQFSSDEIRFYLCLNSPELDQSNFVYKNFSNFVKNTFRPLLQSLLNKVGHLLNFTEELKETNKTSEDITWLNSVTERFRLFYSPESFSPKEAAKLLFKLLNEIMVRFEKNLVTTREEFFLILNAIRAFSHPIIPSFSETIENLMSKKRIRRMNVFSKLKIKHLLISNSKIEWTQHLGRNYYNLLPSDVKNAGIALSVLSPNQQSTQHAHPDREGFYIKKGHAALRVEDAVVKLSEGDICYVEKNVSHSMVNTDDRENLEYICFWWNNALC